MMDFPSPNTAYPLFSGLQRTGFLKNFIKNPNIIVGDYTYYDDNNGDIENFERNVLYHFDFLGDKLIIGKFCQIASDVKFLMNGMFHLKDSITTFPFTIFSNELMKKLHSKLKFPYKGDTVIGNDVWIGYNVTFMPGVKVGNGAVIGTNSLITKDVPPYTIVGGSPAKIIKQRFSDEQIILLQKICWWDWDIEKIIENIEILLGEGGLSNSKIADSIKKCSP